MNRKEIKAKAKEIIKTNKWNIWKPILVIALFSFCVSFVAGLVAGIVQGADADLNLVGDIVEFILGIVLLPATVGMCMYTLKLIRKEEYSLNDLKSYYPYFISIFLLDLLIGIFTFLWSILFIIPGIIAAISYSMAFFIIAEKPDEKPMAVIAKSKEMMNGHKMDYFVFELSFIGWIFLVGITFGIAAIYVVPYMTVANALFYEEVKGK